MGCAPLVGTVAAKAAGGVASQLVEGYADWKNIIHELAHGFWGHKELTDNLTAFYEGAVPWMDKEKLRLRAREDNNYVNEFLWIVRRLEPIIDISKDDTIMHDGKNLMHIGSELGRQVAAAVVTALQDLAKSKPIPYRQVRLTLDQSMKKYEHCHTGCTALLEDCLASARKLDEITFNLMNQAPERFEISTPELPSQSSIRLWSVSPVRKLDEISFQLVNQAPERFEISTPELPLQSSIRLRSVSPVKDMKRRSPPHRRQPLLRHLDFVTEPHFEFEPVPIRPQWAINKNF